MTPSNMSSSRPLRRALSLGAALTATLSLGCDREDVDESGPGFREGKSGGGGPKRVEVCHDGSTLTIPEPAIAAHLGHGDALGPCADACTDASCDDGDLCTTDACNGDGTCGHAAVICDDTDPCTADACDPAVGCTHAPVTGASCDDGNGCTSADSCSAGVCAGAPVVGCCAGDDACEDGNPCTIDTCNAGRCANEGVDCASNDACMAGFCDPITGDCDATPVSCDDGDPCTADACAAMSGCWYTATPEARACIGDDVVIGTVGSDIRDITISGPDVVWELSDGRLIHHDATGGDPVELLGGSWPRLSGRRLVYSRASSIVMRDLEAFETTLAWGAFDAPYGRPAIDGDLVSFGSSAGSIFLRNVASETGGLIATEFGGASAIDGSFVVFERDRRSAPGNLDPGDIDLYDASNGGTMRLTGPDYQYRPDISDMTVVYMEGLYEMRIVARDLSAGTSRYLASTARLRDAPKISGTRVVWAEANNDLTMTLVLYDLLTDRRVELAREAATFVYDIDGDRIAYGVNLRTPSEIHLVTLRQ